MNCDKCGSQLLIAKSKIQSEIDSEDVYSVQDLVCTNAKCDLFCGVDLNNPNIIAKTIKNKIN